MLLIKNPVLKNYISLNFDLIFNMESPSNNKFKNDIYKMIYSIISKFTIYAKNLFKLGKPWTKYNSYMIIKYAV